MRPPIFRGFHDLGPDMITVDNFAGGGGATDGIRAALRRPVDVAINHSRTAIAMHEANHPETRHYHSDIWEVDPREVCGSRRIAAAWFSPDCTHHSRAKGAAPRCSGRRALADVVIRWAELPHHLRPLVIFLENVEEFRDWGPLDEDGYPIKSRAGENFRAWLAKLVDLGYHVEYRSLVAADYGAPTSRKRLFLVARCDGRPIIWPSASHGRGCPDPWRPASDVIDWSLPCRSIFDRPKPLAEATQRRIAAGLMKYVFTSAHPFIVPLTHQGGARVHGIADPFRTVTAAHRGELALVAPSLIQTGYGERPGQAPRCLDLADPLGTVVAGGAKHALVMAWLAKHYGGPNGHATPGIDARSPLSAVTATDHHAIVKASFVSKYFGTSTGSSADEPLPTVLTGGGRGGGHLAAVQAFLIKYYGAEGQQQSLFDSLHTVTTRARFGLVMVDGLPFQLADIRMRMFEPRELFSAQSFRPDYDITCESTNGKALTKTQQIELAGNSVPPLVAQALVAANTTGAEWRAAA